MQWQWSLRTLAQTDYQYFPLLTAAAAEADQTNSSPTAAVVVAGVVDQTMTPWLVQRRSRQLAWLQNHQTMSLLPCFQRQELLRQLEQVDQS